MTALADVEDKVRGFAAGGVDYITKPIQVEELHARVDTHLTIRRLQQSLEERIKELDAFAHTVAHDLKNPLAAVIGYVQLIESLNISVLPEHARMALAVIRPEQLQDVFDHRRAIDTSQRAQYERYCDRPADDGTDCQRYPDRLSRSNGHLGR